MNKYADGIVTSSNNRSPLKIVAAKRSMAHSYPYRDGKEKGGLTLNIYSNKSLGSVHTYITSHYMMYAYDYELYNGRHIANVEIQGGKGYVEVEKVDIVPMIYIRNAASIKLGGNEQYYSQQGKSAEAAYDRTVWQEYYQVEENGSVNELRVRAHRPHKSIYDVDIVYGAGPSFMTPGTKYYSPDGVRFYTDRDLTKRAGDDYYSYYQWLPVRSQTNYKSADLAKHLADKVAGSKSVMTGETHHFIEQGMIYGMNPILMFNQAGLESAHGTSSIALNKNNIFGWGAVDSNPSGGAQIYSAIGRGVQSHMSKQLAAYMHINDWRHFGPSFGNKGSGITVKYASDPYYGIKIASLSYHLDKKFAFKDYNAYKLSKIKDSNSKGVRQTSSGSANWYTTKAGLKDQTLLDFGTTGTRIKTGLMMPVYGGVYHAGLFPLNIYGEFGYIDSSEIVAVKAHGPQSAKLPSPPSGWEFPAKESVLDPKSDAVTTANVNFRESYTTSRESFGVLPEGTKLSVYPSSEGWALTSHNGNTGFVHMDYLDIDRTSRPDPKPDPQPDTEPTFEKPVKVRTTDALRFRKSYTTDSEIITVFPKGTELMAEFSDIGWARATYDGQTGYLSMEYLERVDGGSVPTQPAYKLGDVNGDGKIDAVDVMLVRQYIANYRSFDSKQKNAADVNGDGKINAVDVMKMRRVIAGIDKNF